MNVVGIGTDIVECLRIAQMVERHGELFLGRVFTSLEIEYCSSRKAATQHYAGRWAAKEAILKAMVDNWQGVFRYVLGQVERNYTGEMIDVRNRWAHEKPFSCNGIYSTET